MHIRDRILELRRVKAGDLAPDPRNWRAHPQAQQDALRGLLAEIGYADALLVRQLPDGRMMIIDGHLRAETTPNVMVPVLVLDVDEVEAARMLATLDPLAGLAEADTGKLAELLNEVDFRTRQYGICWRIWPRTRRRPIRRKRMGRVKTPTDNTCPNSIRSWWSATAKCSSAASTRN